MIDWIFPIVGALIACLTPKGLYKEINTVLACLLIFIFGYEQHIIEKDLFDTPWHDVVLFLIYGFTALLFYRIGGRRQFKLAALGMSLCVIYGGFGFYYDDLGFYFDARDYYWTEAFITLSILQLIIAADGVAWSALYKIGGHHGRSNHGSGDNTHHSGHG